MAALTQSDADDLREMDKRCESDVAYEFPYQNDSLVIPLVSADGTERFLFDLNRKGRIKLSKLTLQERAYTSIVLVRLDIDGPPHRNPGMQDEIPCPHLHIYREGFDIKFAEAAPTSIFTDTADLYATCFEFLSYCNVTLLPTINNRLVV